MLIQKIFSVMILILCTLIPLVHAQEKNAEFDQAAISAEIAGHSLSKVQRWLHEIALPKFDPDTELYFARGDGEVS